MWFQFCLMKSYSAVFCLIWCWKAYLSVVHSSWKVFRVPLHKCLKDHRNLWLYINHWVSFSLMDHLGDYDGWINLKRMAVDYSWILDSLYKFTCYVRISLCVGALPLLLASFMYLLCKYTVYIITVWLGNYGSNVHYGFSSQIICTKSCLISCMECLLVIVKTCLFYLWLC